LLRIHNPLWQLNIVKDADDESAIQSPLHLSKEYLVQNIIDYAMKEVIPGKLENKVLQ